MTSGTFRYAITRIPGETYAQGLTSGAWGVPDYALALEQHQRYCQVLQECGLEVETLGADSGYPDSTFVEDTAILIPQHAILTNPGAASRKGEVALIKDALSKGYTSFYTITSSGTLDGGDICEADDQFFIGISERTNETGARQLSVILIQQGYTTTMVDIRGVEGILHLKSGVAYLGENNLVLIDALIDRQEFKGYFPVRVHPEENYAANCVRVNDSVLLASGFPRLKASVERLGCQVVTLDMSEYQKMDGGLSCLSLRY